MSVRRITVRNTGTDRLRRSCSPWRTTSELCHWVISTPATRMRGLAAAIPLICAAISLTPQIEKPSTSIGITTSSAAIRAAMLAAVKPGGQSKIM